MNKFIRAVIVVATIFLIGMSLFSIRYFFDRRDMKAASNLVMTYQPFATSQDNLAEIMETINEVPPGFMHCQARVVSRYEKKLSVECLSAYIWNKSYSFLWSVNLANQSVQPEGQATKELLAKYFEEHGEDQSPRF